MTLRTRLTPEQRRAHLVLDQVKAGLAVDDMLIRWALCVLGDYA